MTDTLGLVLVFVFSGLFFIGLASFLCGHKLEQLLVTPGALFCAFYGATYFVIPGITIATGGFVWQPSYQISTVLTAGAGFFLFGVAVVAAWVFHSERGGFTEGLKIFQSDEGAIKISLKEVLAITSPFLLVSIFGVFQLLVNIIMSGGLAGYFAKRLLLVQDEGLIQMPLQWWTIYSIPFIYLFHTSTNKKEKLRALGFAVMSLLLAIGVGSLQGSRTRTMIPIAFFLLSWIILQGRKGLTVQAKTFLLSSVLGLAVLAVALGVAREVAITGQGSKAAELAKSKYSTESFGEFENAFWLIENRGQIDLEHGDTFLAAMAVVIPRALWAEKPIGSGPLMRNLTLPYAFEPGRKDNRSPVTTGLPPEAYMNYGFLGFPAVGLVYGCFLAFCGWLLRHARHPFLFGLFVAITYRGVEFLSMEAAGGVANVLFLVVPFVLMSLLLAGYRKLTANKLQTS